MENAMGRGQQGGSKENEVELAGRAGNGGSGGCHQRDPSKRVLLALSVLPRPHVHCPARHGREKAAGVFPAPIASSLCPSFLNFACPHCNHLSSGLLWAAASSESGSRNQPCCLQSQDLQRTNPGQGKDHKLYLHEPKRGDKEIL